MPSACVIAVSSPDAVEQVRALFLEYADSVGVEGCFRGFEREVAELPGAYASPAGCLLLAYCGEEVAGCVGLRQLDVETCEMKRLYVRPTFRGQHMGGQLVDALLEEARGIGYRKMRLETLPTMQTALAMYRSLGFEPIAPYYDHPAADVMFFELDLKAAP